MTTDPAITVGESAREKIQALQRAVHAMPQIDLSAQTKHHFADGMYARELFRPAGTLIVGKVHRKEHFYMVMSGVVAITNGDGNAREVTGPCVIVSHPGAKRAVLAITDATCITVHRTDLQDLDKIEEQLIEPESESLFDARNAVKKEAVACHL